MYRAAFMACGLYMVLTGAGLMFVEDVQLNRRISARVSPVLSSLTPSDSEGRCHIRPPEWAPYTLMGVGAVTMLYAVALPKN